MLGKKCFSESCCILLYLPLSQHLVDCVWIVQGCLRVIVGIIAVLHRLMSAVSTNCNSPPVSSYHLLAIIEQMMSHTHFAYSCSACASTLVHRRTFESRSSPQ